MKLLLLTRYTEGFLIDDDDVGALFQIMKRAVPVTYNYAFEKLQVTDEQPQLQVLGKFELLPLVNQDPVFLPDTISTPPAPVNASDVQF